MAKRKAKAAEKSYVEYRSNNSGGHWWLKDDDWFALEKAGWKVAWVRLENAYTDDGDYQRDPDGTPKLVPAGQGNSRYPSLASREDDRWLGALAKSAFKVGATSVREAADEWEAITHQSATEAGCPCCGQPHNFTLYRDGKYVESGPHTSYSASW